MLTGLNHITLAVSDLTRALTFYTEILGFTGHVQWDRGAYLSLGSLWLCLSCDQVDPRQDYTHIALDIAPEHFAPFAERLRALGVPEWKTNTSEGNSLYLLDPDGHRLEIHAGNLQSRLNSLQLKPYQGLKWLTLP